MADVFPRATAECGTPPLEAIPPGALLGRPVVPCAPEDIPGCPDPFLDFLPPLPPCPTVTIAGGDEVSDFVSIGSVPYPVSKFSVTRGECCDFDFNVSITLPISSASGGGGLGAGTINLSSGQTLNFNGTTVNVTGGTWTVTNTNYTYSNVVVNYVNNTVINFAQINVHFTANQTWFIDNGVTLTWVGDTWNIEISNVNVDNSTWVFGANSTVALCGTLLWCRQTIELTEFRTNDLSLGPEPRIVVRLSSSLPCILTGLVPGDLTQVVVLHNTGNVPITLTHNSILSAPGNCFFLPRNEDRTLQSRDSMVVWHDPDRSRWVDLADTVLDDVSLQGDATGPVGDTTVVALQHYSVRDTPPFYGDVLTWDGTAWTPMEDCCEDSLSTSEFSLSGDVTGPPTLTTVRKLQGFPVSGATPLPGDIITWTGDEWIPQQPDDEDFSLQGDVIGPPNDTIVTGLQGFPVALIIPLTGDVLTYNGTRWVPQAPDHDSLSDFSLFGDVIGPPDANTVTALQGFPVADTLPLPGDLLTWNGSTWEPGPPGDEDFSLSGDVIGPPDFNTVTALQGFPVAPDTPTEGDTLLWTGTEWVPGAVPDGGAFSLSGDVTGPPIANTVRKIQGFAVDPGMPEVGNTLVWTGVSWLPADLPHEDFSHSGDVVGPTLNLRVQKLQGFPVAPASPAANNVLTWDGTRWLPASPTSGEDFSHSGDVVGPTDDLTVRRIQGFFVDPILPLDGDVLTWTGEQWEPEQPGQPGDESSHSGDVVGPTLNTRVKKIQGFPVADDTPAESDVLTWTGTQWVPAATSGGGSSPTATRDQATMGGSYAITGSGWEDTSLFLTLPSAGTYLVVADATAQSSAALLGSSSAAGVISVRLFNVPGSAAVTGTQRAVVTAATAGPQYWGSATISTLITVAGSTTIRLEAERAGGGVTWGISSITGGQTHMLYVKL